MNGVIMLFRLHMDRPSDRTPLSDLVWHCMFPRVSGTRTMTTTVPKTTVDSIVDNGSRSFTTPSAVRLGNPLTNTVGTTVKHPVTLPVTEKAASVLWATSSRPLTWMTLTSPAGLELRLITPLVLPVVVALEPTVMLILDRVRVGVLPALLLATVISRFPVRLVPTQVSPLLGPVLVTKLLMLVLLVTVPVASGPLLAITMAWTFTPCRLVKCLCRFLPMILPSRMMFSIPILLADSRLVMISGALFRVETALIWLRRVLCILTSTMLFLCLT